MTGHQFRGEHAGTAHGKGVQAVGLHAFTKKQLRQLLRDELVHLGRIGLAAGRLHHGADDGAGDLGVTGAVLLHDVGVGGQRLVDGGLDSAVVARPQAAGGDDLVDVALPARTPSTAWRPSWWSTCLP